MDHQPVTSFEDMSVRDVTTNLEFQPIIFGLTNHLSHHFVGSFSCFIFIHNDPFIYITSVSIQINTWEQVEN